VPEPGGEAVVEGIVDRVVFVDRTGYTVLLLGTDGDTPVKAAGTILQGTQPGESLRLAGSWRRHPAHGTQFAVDDCTHTLPASLYAMRRYLSSGLIKGIGPKLAAAIVAEFREETMRVLEETPERLLEVHQIGDARYARIIEAWQLHQDIRELMLLLHGAGVPAGHAPRICQYFAEETDNVLDLVQHHPYRLTEVRGIGFHLADTVALWLGTPEQSPERLRAGLLHALDQTGVQGHCYVPETKLLHDGAMLLGQDEALLPRELDALRAAGHLLVELLPHRGRETALVFSRRLHIAETSLAKHLVRLHRATTALARRGDWTHARLPLPMDAPALHPDQERAVRMALTQPVSVLTGGPGCGKSFTVRTIVDVAEAAGAQVSLAAPTGRAAKRLSELTGNQATTVHRLLRPSPNQGDSLFDCDPMDADLFVIDEASMLDLVLCERLLAKIPTGAHILFVGDTDQLPSIGPGTVLADLLRVPDVPRTALQHVFRQEQGSAITVNAHRIIHGETPVNGGDFWYVPQNNPDRIPDLVLDLVTRRLPQAYDVAPADIQVLCPTRKHPAGTYELGLRLQDALNPAQDGDAQHWCDARPFRLGDRVIPTRNDPRKGPSGVFNGSTATVITLDTEQRELEILLDDGDTATYTFDELDDVLHAYAITVHRAQGSEYPIVVIPLTTSSAFMLRRNLLYTAVTRGKHKVILVGEEEALHRALATAEPRRHTTLALRLHDALGHEPSLPAPLWQALG
jgi:exodeoxyribonuclease V alpha subunit